MPPNASGLYTFTTGLDTTNLDRLIDGALEQEAKELVEYVGELVLDLAKTWAPEGQGRLKESLVRAAKENIFVLEFTPEHIMCIVGTEVPYAVFLEFGTRRMSARPFLTPAIEEVYPYWAEQIETLFGRAVGAI